MQGLNRLDGGNHPGDIGVFVGIVLWGCELVFNPGYYTAWVKQSFRVSMHIFFLLMMMMILAILGMLLTVWAISGLVRGRNKNRRKQWWLNIINLWSLKLVSKT